MAECKAAVRRLQVVRSQPNSEDVSRRLGISWANLVHAEGEERARTIYGFAREVDLSLEYSSSHIHAEVYEGVDLELERHHGTLTHLVEAGQRMAARLYWAPPEFGLDTFRVLEAVSQVRSIMQNTAEMVPEFLAGTALWRKRRGASMIPKSDLLTVLDKILARDDRPRHGQARGFLSCQLPEAISFSFLAALESRMTPKADSVRVSGCPGRLLLVPVVTGEWSSVSVPEENTTEYVFIYRPLHEGIGKHFQGLNRMALSLEAVEERDHGTRDEFFKITDHGSFPGSLVYARLAIIREGRYRNGYIVLTQSDVTQHAAEYAPAVLCREIVPLLTGFFREQGCHRAYFPTLPYIVDRSDNLIEEWSPARGRLWKSRMETIYGQPPEGFDSKPTRRFDREYYSLSLK